MARRGFAVKGDKKGNRLCLLCIGFQCGINIVMARDNLLHSAELGIYRYNRSDNERDNTCLMYGYIFWQRKNFRETPRRFVLV